MTPYEMTSGGREPSREDQMDYELFFKSELDLLRNEGRYRVFADLERKAGNAADETGVLL